MKDFIQYINESQVQEIERKHISISWEDCGKKIAKQWSSIPADLKDKMEEEVFSDVSNFYSKTPHKRNVSSMCSVQVSMELDDNSAIVKKLLNLYRKVGLNNWILNFPSRVASGELWGTSYTRGTQRDKIAWKEHFYNSWRSRGKEAGNGYNGISGELVTEYREKFLDCINGADVVWSKDKYKNLKIPAMVPRYNVTYIATYDKSKVNKLIEDIMNNEEMQQYIHSLDSTGKAIDKYYSSKRSGEYTGD